MDDTGSLDTGDLQLWVAELQAGRPDAAEPIFRKIIARVDRMARSQLAKFPRVGRFVDADDVVQSSLIRLLAAFRSFRPVDRGHFYALTNTLIRRELLDLAKHYYGPHGAGTNTEPVAVGEGTGEYAPAAAIDPDLERWTELHRAVERLPTDEREVVGLLLYHDWPQADIAELLNVSTRTVQRWTADAFGKLRAEGVWD